jgi:hypothetical protein
MLLNAYVLFHQRGVQDCIIDTLCRVYGTGNAYLQPAPPACQSDTPRPARYLSGELILRPRSMGRMVPHNCGLLVSFVVQPKKQDRY